MSLILSGTNISASQAAFGTGTAYTGSNSSGYINCSADGFVTVVNNKITAANNCTGTLTIPEGLTVIGDISGQSRMTSIVVPRSLRTLETRALAESNLTSFSTPIGSQLTSIGQTAFQGLVKSGVGTLKTVDLSNSTLLTSIGSPSGSVFNDASRLDWIHLPPSVTTLYANTFNFISTTYAESTFQFPESLTSVSSATTQIDNTTLGRITTIAFCGPNSTVRTAIQSLATTKSKIFVSSGEDCKLWTTTNLSSSATTTNTGVRVTLTATVSQPGDVTFYAGSNAIADCSNVATDTVTATATCDWTPTVSGSYRITATDTPTASSRYKASTSSPVTVTVNAAPYTVTFDLNTLTGTAIPQGSYYPSTPKALPSTSSLYSRGYSPTGKWSTVANDTSTVVADSYTATSDITLYAVYKPDLYFLRYDSNTATGGTLPDSRTIDFGSTVNLSTNNLTKTGYDFKGWFVYRPGQPEAYFDTGTAFTMSAQYVFGWALPRYRAIRLYANFEQASYTVNYSLGSAGATPVTGLTLDSGTIGVAQTKLYSDQFTLPVLSDTRTTVGGTTYEFIGWSSGTDTSTAGSAYSMPDRNLTFTAKWIALYTVNYVLNGGSCTSTQCADNIQADTNPLTLPLNDPTRTGHTFLNWKAQSGETFTANGGTTVAINRFTFTAEWIKTPRPVTYVTSQGAAPTQAPLYYQDRLTVADAPVITGYTFENWTRSGGGSERVNPGNEFLIGTSSETLTANWSADSYTVVVDLNGSSDTVTVIADKIYNQSVTVPATPNFGDNTFRGWSIDDGVNVIAPNGSFAVPDRQPLVLKALWNYDYVIIFQPGDHASGEIDDLVGSGSSATLSNPDSFTIESGYTFNGWRALNNNLYTNGQVLNLSESTYLMLTAQWTAPYVAPVAPAPVNREPRVIVIAVPEVIKEPVTKPEKIAAIPTRIRAEAEALAASIARSQDVRSTTSSNTTTVAANSPTGTTDAANSSGTTAAANSSGTTAAAISLAIANSATAKVIYISDAIVSALSSKVVVTLTDDDKLNVKSLNGFTGKVIVPVITQSSTGDISVVYSTVVISPEPAIAPQTTPLSVKASQISWSAPASQIISYTVTVGSGADAKSFSTKTTNFRIPALVGPKTVITVQALGNDGTVSTVTIPTYSPKTPVPATKVNFALGSAVLSPAQKAELDRIATVISSNGFTRSVVNGNTDTQGSVALNRALSLARANAVKTYLEVKLPDVSFRVSGNGSKRPINNGTNAKAFAENRRAEISVW